MASMSAGVQSRVFSLTGTEKALLVHPTAATINVVVGMKQSFKKINNLMRNKHKNGNEAERRVTSASV